MLLQLTERVPAHRTFSLLCNIKTLQIVTYIFSSFSLCQEIEPLDDFLRDQLIYSDIFQGALMDRVMPYLKRYPPSIGVIEKAYQMLYLCMSTVNKDFMDSYQTVQREYLRYAEGE